MDSLKSETYSSCTPTNLFADSPWINRFWSCSNCFKQFKEVALLFLTMETGNVGCLINSRFKKNYWIVFIKKFAEGTNEITVVITMGQL